MVILLSLTAATAYGLSDFVGGVVSRRVNPWTIAFTSQVGGAAAVLLLSLFVDGSPDRAALAWAVLAGVGNGVGTAFLYRGLSAGRMGVVAPVSGVGAALVPLAAGLVAGERPSGLAWVGIAAALPAIWLVAREPGTPTGPATRAALLDAILAGLGFGTLFAALGQIPQDAGLLPLSLNQAVGAVIVMGLAVTLRAAWRPRESTAYAGLGVGILGATATGLFLVATQTGQLAIAAVLTSFYPAFTVLLAASVLREHVHRQQVLGLGLCALAVGLIAAG